MAESCLVSHHQQASISIGVLLPQQPGRRCLDWSYSRCITTSGKRFASSCHTCERGDGGFSLEAHFASTKHSFPFLGETQPITGPRTIPAHHFRRGGTLLPKSCQWQYLPERGHGNRGRQLPLFSLVQTTAKREDGRPGIPKGKWKGVQLHWEFVVQDAQLYPELIVQFKWSLLPQRRLP